MGSFSIFLGACATSALPGRARLRQVSFGVAAFTLFELIGERGGARTHDPVIKSHVLYRLSYALTSGSRRLPGAVDPRGTIAAQTPPAFGARENRLFP